MSVSQHRVGGMPRPPSALALGGPGSDNQRGLASTLISEASDLRYPSWQRPGLSRGDSSWAEQRRCLLSLLVGGLFADRLGPSHLLG